MKIAFVHPDLGLGGAERFVLDAALSLESFHQPIIYTPFHDITRTFIEARPPNPLITVKTISPLLPRSFFNRFHALLCALRVCIISFYICLFHRPDVVILDLVSLPILVFKLFRIPVVFYCHYPDQLLATSLQYRIKPSVLKRTYRFVIDRLEEFSLRFAKVICCNSHFTKQKFESVFPTLKSPVVIYPSISINEINQQKQQQQDENEKKTTLISINRYERKKSITLAIETLSVIHDRYPEHNNLSLVIAGGYDSRLSENIDYYNHLQTLIQARDLQAHVTLLQNITEQKRKQLYDKALAVLYTPSEEHFGIVPLEAMAASVPVIAVNSGGPRESIEHEQTGFLCESSAAEFAKRVVWLAQDEERGRQMGEKGRERVQRLFSRQVLGKQLQNVIVRAVRKN